MKKNKRNTCVIKIVAISLQCKIKTRTSINNLNTQRKMRTKTFTIENNEHNLNWVKENLDTRDYEVKGNDIIITYFEDFQKNDILQAISEKTYNVIFNDDNNSNDKGFEATLEYCKDYIQSFNGTNHSYFEDYKGGIVQVVCNETGEVVYEEEVI